ncbi:MAG: molecular chaperone DnaK, partial [Deltaproteobacteria bacterium]|nr:molecular chaperone DnaK [Deltaproteobacteria bacterium]
MIVGIDLGTTNSLIATLERGRPKLFLGENGSALIPSVVQFLDGEQVRVGSEAKNSLNTHLSKTLYSAKRFMGRGLSDVQEWLKILPFDFSASTQQMIRFKVGEKSYTPM